MQPYNRRRIALLQEQTRRPLSPEERGQLLALQQLVEAWLDIEWPLPRVADAAAQKET